MKFDYVKFCVIDKEDLLNILVIFLLSVLRVCEWGFRFFFFEYGCIYNMSDCYERFWVMVFDILNNRWMSKVEIL